MKFLLVVLLACSKPVTVNGIDLHDALKDPVRIEVIRIDPDAHGAATYDITWKDRAKHSHATAEFPGKFTDELVAARIPYIVGAAGQGEHSISMTQLREELGSAPSTITSVKIDKLVGRSRYVVTRKSGAVDVAYGESSGHVLDELRAAGLAP